MLRKLLSAIFPVACITCQKQLVKTEVWFCSHCEVNFDEFVETNNNLEELDQLFWGKADVKQVYAPFYFYKKEKLQRIIHEFKYNQNKALAITMGDKMAQSISLPLLQRQNSIVTFVPMTRQKQRKRGYNQAEELARGFATRLQLPLHTLLKKVKNTESQTDKGAYERHLNMNGIFEATGTKQNQPDVIILIDDVITTGATLAQCAKILNERHPKTTVLVAALAVRRLEA